MRHLNDDHKNSEFWVCFACNETVQFDREDDFVMHTLEEHHDTISNDQICALKAICKRSVPTEINSCPLCAKPTENDTGVDKGALIDHVAEHVHSFSLRSLPWPAIDDLESKERIDEGARKVTEWLDKNALSNATKEIPPLLMTERPSSPHYFDNHEYFLQNVESTSSSRPDSVVTMERELQKLREEGSLDFDESSIDSSSNSASSK